MELIDNYTIKNDKIKVNDVPIINNASPNAYHYTSAESFKSIIQNETLWFSDIKYLNDYSEVLDGVDLLCNHIIKNGKKSKYIEDIEAIKNGSSTRNTFIFSMSLGKDELPLWNYYLKNNSGQGYNIEFDYGKLLESIISKNIDILKGCTITFGNAIYKIDFKSSFLNDASKVLTAKLFAGISYIFVGNKIVDKTKLSVEELNLDIDDLIGDYYQVFKFNSSTGNFDRGIFLEVIYFSKHYAFNFEKEMRIVIDVSDERFVYMQEKGMIKYRTYNGNLIPYIELEFDLDCISGINIAPMFKSDIAKKGIENLLLSKGLACENIINGIKKSEIPIRY